MRRHGGRAQFIEGPHRPDDRAGVHATEVFLKPPEHLAAALGLPGIVLWGEPSAPVWRPPSARFQIVEASGVLASLSVEDFRNAIRALAVD